MDKKALFSEIYKFVGVMPALIKTWIMRGDKICQRDFMSACEQEMARNFDGKARQRIGF